MRWMWTGWNQPPEGLLQLPDLDVAVLGVGQHVGELAADDVVPRWPLIVQWPVVATSELARPDAVGLGQAIVGCVRVTARRDGVVATGRTVVRRRRRP